jgi:hypothetical protein
MRVNAGLDCRAGASPDSATDNQAGYAFSRIAKAAKQIADGCPERQQWERRSIVNIHELKGILKDTNPKIGPKSAVMTAHRGFDWNYPGIFTYQDGTRT